MQGEKELLLNLPGSFRKRYLFRTEKNIAFNLNPPALNLTPTEYNEMLAEIKKRGNLG